MLTEPQVIAAVCAELISRGYQIEQQLEPHQTGEDIIAIKRTPVPYRLSIEAKGATSSRRGSKRYGKPFESAAIRVHVAEALYKTAEVLSKPSPGTQTRVGIALPDIPQHRTLVQRIQPVLTQLGIAVFWVQEDGSVQIASAEPI